MKNTLAVIGLLGVACTATATTAIPIPDGSFEGLTTTLNSPLAGAATGYIGAWTAQMTGVSIFSGSMDSGRATSFAGGPPAANGTNDLRIALPASALITASLSQVLTNNLCQPDATYVLSVDLDPSTTANLINSLTLALNAGTNTVGSISGSSVASVINSDTGFQTLQLTCVTGDTAPAGTLSVSLGSTNVAAVLGDIYVDNFTLTVTPFVVQMNTPTMSGTNFVVSGYGGEPGGTYEMITSTNLAIPYASWTLLSTNQFNTNGLFTQNIPINFHTPARFFRLLVP